MPELSGATAIEFSHRSASGVALALVVVLFLLVRRGVAKGEPARLGVTIALISIVGEALIGAMIVLAEWVADDDSIARAIAVPLHLVNTLLLLAALTLTIFWLSGGGRLDRQANPTVWRWIVVGGVAIVLIAATGAITALADTLFPKEGIGIDVEAGAHFLTRLRVIHPILAVTAASVAWWKLEGTARSGSARNIVGLVALMMITGVLNVAFGVPTWMQITHLGLADALWISYIFLAARTLEISTEKLAAAG